MLIRVAFLAVNLFNAPLPKSLETTRPIESEFPNPLLPSGFRRTMKEDHHRINAKGALLMTERDDDDGETSNYYGAPSTSE